MSPPADAPRRRALEALLAGMALVAGCASPGPARTPLPMATPAALGLAAEASLPVVPEQWWRSLGDPALDALVERALAGQPSLQAVAARLARAEAAAQAVAAAHGPQAGLGLDLSRQRYPEHGLYPPPLAGSQRSSATLQASGVLELDFFGRHGAALEAALGQQRAASAELAAARVLLAGRVAQAWVGLSSLIGQREVAVRALAQREAMLGLTRQRVQAGFDTRVELRQAEATLPEARQQIEALEEQISLARHQLASLSGQPPGALATLQPALAPLQAGPLPARLGADLLGRRADIVAARWRVEAALQDVAAARAQFYPDVNLVGFIGLSSIGLDQLLQLGSRNIGFGPALRLPLFDGGRLRAQLQGRGADLDAAIAAYNGALLEALREVADAGTSLQSLDRQRQEQAQAQAAAESAYELAQLRYRAGLGTFLTVLSAETSVLAQRRLGVDLQARALDARIALMRALGGGWSDAGPATRPAHAAAAAPAALPESTRP
ncbi:MAG: efflux transporter outer membrane subunit [Burkholderiales bacterium]|nr:efflux transporter outer membrane subunit [Burkholderiales bacterium]